MDIELFDYDLPPELIAQHPVRRRDESRLMILDRSDGSTAIKPFARIVDYIGSRDILVVNNTKVFKARLWGNRRTGGRVEVFLVRALDDGPGLAWLALVSPSRRVKEGEYIDFGSDRVHLVSYLGDGQWRIAFNSRTQRERIIRRNGHVPLPHYIKREDTPSDIRRYQTVFADSERVGAVAAPTAGFHFTRRILDHLQTRGVELVELTLHVGPGTFKPVKAGRIEDHVVDPEFAELSPEAAGTINSARECGGRVFAVGTTSVRTLESAAIENGRVQPLAQMVDLYIRPGHRFRVVDHMITNFHLPKSSLLILVSAFAGREQILKAYGEAVRNRMRFYSYGDAMLIL